MTTNIDQERSNEKKLTKFSCVRQNYFGEALKEARLAKSITQKQAAALLNITQAQWSAYEAGRARPHLDLILQIANSLEIDALDLLDSAIQKSSYFKDNNSSTTNTELKVMEKESILI